MCEAMGEATQNVGWMDLHGEGTSGQADWRAPEGFPPASGPRARFTNSLKSFRVYYSRPDMSGTWGQSQGGKTPTFRTASYLA